jgi:Zn-dependent protease
MNIENIVFIVVLIISIIFHEIAHGYAADKLGDPTARLAGRLSLNPLVHIDWIGSVALPFFLVISGAPFVLGWAKPVPFNIQNMKHPKRDAVIVALAGPLTNIIIAILGSIVFHLGVFAEGGSLLLVSIVITNIALAIFNLIPIPPLDGHHLLFALISDRHYQVKRFLQQYSFIILIVFVIYGWRLISPLILRAADLLL